MSKIKGSQAAVHESSRDFTKLALALLASALLLTSMSARAGFELIQAPKTGYRPLNLSPELAGAEPAETVAQSALKFLGQPDGAIEIRRGMGRDMRLADALRLIAPTGWRGFGRKEAADTFDGDKLVSWKGGRPWTDVLNTLAQEQGLSIEVDWNNRHLYVGK